MYEGRDVIILCLLFYMAGYVTRSLYAAFWDEYRRMTPPPRDRIADLQDALERIVLHDPDRPGLHGEPVDVLRSAVSEAKNALSK